MKGSSLLYIGVGSTLSGTIIAGLLVGYFMDSLFDSRPIFMILCLFLGAFGGFIKALKILTTQK